MLSNLTTKLKLKKENNHGNKSKQETEIPIRDIIFLSIMLLFIEMFAPVGLKMRWICLTLTLFNVVTNESIKSLGVFLASNKKLKWIELFTMFSIVSFLFLLVTWKSANGEIHYKKLLSFPYLEELKMRHYLMPILLLIMTYNKIPASTTFLILSVFASRELTFLILFKSLCAYAFSFGFTYGIIKIINYFIKAKKWHYKNNYIFPIQCTAVLLLWVNWITQNIGNALIYVPRQLDLYQLCLFIVIFLAFLAFLLYNNGGPIQGIVNNKTHIKDPISNIIISLCYTITIRVFFKIHTRIPIATTFIFIGVLSGREYAIHKKHHHENVMRNIWKELWAAILGIIVSLIFSEITSLF